MTNIEIGSGNVFADLGLEQAEILLAKAKIAAHINHVIGKRGLTQSQAAEILVIDQPKVSALARGKLSGFSLDRLFRLLVSLDCSIDITIKEKQ